MRILFLAFIIVVFFSSVALAQEKTADKKFIFTGAFLVGTTVFDVETTFAALNKCGNTCHEGNSLMYPLVQSGRPAVYAVNGAIDAGLIAWSYKLKKDGSKLWWFLPIVAGTAHGLAGGFNMRFVF